MPAPLPGRPPGRGECARIIAGSAADSTISALQRRRNRLALARGAAALWATAFWATAVWAAVTAEAQKATNWAPPADSGEPRFNQVHRVHGQAKHEPPANAIRVRGLTKDYAGRRGVPGKRALDGVDLDIPRGSLFGLLGPNGAGKSTLINILAQLVNPTAGTAEIWGHDLRRQPRHAAAAIGVVPQELNLDAFFTPRELLDFQAGLYGVPPKERRTEELLATVGLTEKADAYARQLSGGMRRRLMVAKAMVHAPPVLVLDEPTAGVDIELRQSLWEHIRALKRSGVTVLLTTHYLEEAQALCDTIGIIHHGKLIARDSTSALLRRLDRKELTITLEADLAALPDSLARFQVHLVRPRRLVFHYKPSETRIADILEAVRAAGLAIADLSTYESDLEDLFLHLTSAQAGGPMREAAQ